MEVPKRETETAEAYRMGIGARSDKPSLCLSKIQEEIDIFSKTASENTHNNAGFMPGAWRGSHLDGAKGS